MIQCCCATYSLTLNAKQCGGGTYGGVSMVVKNSAGATVATCTTASSGLSAGSCTVMVPAGNLTITATAPVGTVMTQTITITGSGNVRNFLFINVIGASVSDCGAGPVVGAVVHFSAPGGWSTTCTTGGSGSCSVNPSVDLTGLTVTAYATWDGATTATKTLNPTNAACGSFSFSFASSATVNVTGCSSLALDGASVTVTGPGGETGTGTTNSSGVATATFSPPVVNLSGSYTASASKTRFATNTATASVCSPASIALSPASGYHCVCDCPDPTTDTLTATGPMGAVTLNWSATYSMWAGVTTMSVPDTYQLVGGICQNVAAATMDVVVYFSGCVLNVAMAVCNNGNALRGGTDPIPGGSNSGCLIEVTGTGSSHVTVSCPPGFLWGGTYTMGGDPTTDVDCFLSTFGPNGTVLTFGVSE